ncbi:hypothetical protein BC941DRAFT_473650 [Chlamydoabsidia padenii]|nr:hypothetical protein BC941DRAFT_473650 [Chlamydoabsidia padenii]
MKIHSNTIQAQRISNHSRTDYRRHVMKKKKEQNYGMEEFNGMAAKALIRNPMDLKLKPRQVEPVVFYGDAGQGYGSRIKGYQRQSTTKLQLFFEEKATIHETNEYLTLKLRCLCDSQVVHPRRRDSTKLNSGIAKGTYKMAINIDYPAFTPSTATVTSTVAA